MGLGRDQIIFEHTHTHTVGDGRGGVMGACSCNSCSHSPDLSHLTWDQWEEAEGWVGGV